MVVVDYSRDGLELRMIKLNLFEFLVYVCTLFVNLDVDVDVDVNGSLLDDEG